MTQYEAIASYPAQLNGATREGQTSVLVNVAVPKYLLYTNGSFPNYKQVTYRSLSVERLSELGIGEVVSFAPLETYSTTETSGGFLGYFKHSTTTPSRPVTIGELTNSDDDSPSAILEYATTVHGDQNPDSDKSFAISGTLLGSGNRRGGYLRIRSVLPLGTAEDIFARMQQDPVSVREHMHWMTEDPRVFGGHLKDFIHIFPDFDMWPGLDINKIRFQKVVGSVAVDSKDIEL